MSVGFLCCCFVDFFTAAFAIFIFNVHYCKLMIKLMICIEMQRHYDRFYCIFEAKAAIKDLRSADESCFIGMSVFVSLLYLFIK